VKQDTPHRWPLYKDVSFKFDIESYQGSRSKSNRVALINSFSYLPFQGPIKMSHPDESFAVYDVWPFNSVPLGIEKPEKIYFGRHLANSSRDSILKYDLKKREYISTTSMDSELSLVTANIALAGPGKLFYDPFAGTGSFPIACAHFGAVAWGSDIDGRSMRGQGEKSLPGNFKQYGIQQHFGDCFAADLTHTPLRKARLWDGIVCDPPYGVREGLRVLGCRDPEKTPWLDQWSKENYMYGDLVR
jgi:tRNA (guanine10-N2)-methyltransferase